MHGVPCTQFEYEISKARAGAGVKFQFFSHDSQFTNYGFGGVFKLELIPMYLRMDFCSSTSEFYSGQEACVLRKLAKMGRQAASDSFAVDNPMITNALAQLSLETSRFLDMIPAARRRLLSLSPFSFALQYAMLEIENTVDTIRLETIQAYQGANNILNDVKNYFRNKIPPSDTLMKEYLEKPTIQLQFVFRDPSILLPEAFPAEFIAARIAIILRFALVLPVQNNLGEISKMIEFEIRFTGGNIQLQILMELPIESIGETRNYGANQVIFLGFGIGSVFQVEVGCAYDFKNKKMLPGCGMISF